MSVYTVHEPPLRAADALADPERFAFVRDGLYVWAFLLTPLWMLRHRLWLVLVSYIVISALLDTALAIAGVSSTVVILIDILISILVGLEASTLLRFTLRRRGWRNVGIVSGYDREDAERRFFESWVREAPSQPSAPPPSPPAALTPHFVQPASSGVIGHFPEPGVPR